MEEGGGTGARLDRSPRRLTDVKTLNIAHRGGRSLAPENTMAAAHKALEAGADMWELDVRLTADEQLILIHDDTLVRTSDARERFPNRHPWRVCDFTLAEIQTLDCGSWFNREDPFGQIKAGIVSAQDQRSYIGERAPTLREALEFTRAHDWRVIVELKALSDEDKGELMVRKSVALIEELGMEHRAMLCSFNHDYLRQVRALSPRMATAVLTRKAIRHPVRYLTELGAQAYNPWSLVVRARRVRELRQAGFDIYVWTVNDEKRMRKLIGMGVSGIVTDFPQTLARLLSADTHHIPSNPKHDTRR